MRAMSQVRSVVLAGGGTAGHVNPLLAVADQLRQRHPQVEIAVLGTASGIENQLVPDRGYALHHVPKVPLPRRPSLDFFRLPARLKRAIAAAGQVMDQTQAQVVVGFGGYVSTPAYLAARKRGIPVVIHEQNARPGLANRWGARSAAAVGLTFPGTALTAAHGPTVVTGLPLRADIAALLEDREQDLGRARRQACDRLDLDPHLPTVLVTGGSLGALSINQAVSQAAAQLSAEGIQVLHLTGKGKADAVREATLGLPHYQVREYLTHMHDALAVCDLAVSRAGAGTVCEFAALGIPAIYVPLPIGNGEQRLNALPVVQAGGGLVVADAQLTPAWVRDHLVDMVADAPRLAAMSAAARACGIRDGAARLADLIDQVAS